MLFIRKKILLRVFSWWQYDERTTLELEAAYEVGQDTCELLIAGFIYVIDFLSMMQYRKNEVFRRRRIKRDAATISKKGIAGLKPDATGNDCDVIEMNTKERKVGNETPITPSNTPQSQNSEGQSPVEDSILESFRSLQIGSESVSDRNNNENTLNRGLSP